MRRRQALKHLPAVAAAAGFGSAAQSGTDMQSLPTFTVVPCIL